MGRCYNYAVAQFRTDETRDERLNLAIVLFRDGEAEVILPKSLDKIRAISASVDLDLVRGSLNEIAELDAFVRSQGSISAEERLHTIAQLSSLSFSRLGDVIAPSENELGRALHRLLARLVDPEPVPLRPVASRPTRLLADVRAAFKAEHVLASKDDDINSHRVLSSYRMAEGLAADLILKNGAMHLVQTIDAAADTSSARRVIQSIGMSALVFEYAKMEFGEQNTKPNLIYKASSILEALISPALDAAEHQGAKLINWESRSDRVRFIVELSSLATPLEKAGRKLTVHASAQRKLNLN